MTISQTCSCCGYKGEIFFPPKEEVKKTILTCPRCGNKEDIAYIYNINNGTTLDELERKEYERLKLKYGKLPESGNGSVC